MTSGFQSSEQIIASWVARWHGAVQVLSLDVALDLWEWMGLELSNQEKASVNKLAKMTYAAVHSDDWNPFNIDFDEQTYKTISDLFLGGLDSIDNVVRRKIRYWIENEFESTPNDGEFERRAFVNLMRLLRNEAHCIDDLGLSIEVTRTVMSAIATFFVPPPYAEEQDRMEGLAELSPWDKQVLSGYPDVPLCISKISVILANANVRRFFGAVGERLPIEDVERLRTWCGRIH